LYNLPFFYYQTNNNELFFSYSIPPSIDNIQLSLLE
jgi:hypothetical protein